MDSAISASSNRYSADEPSTQNLLLVKELGFLSLNGSDTKEYQ